MQAVTITVDQRGAVRDERQFDQKKRREREKKTDGDKSGNQNVPRL